MTEKARRFSEAYEAYLGRLKSTYRYQQAKLAHHLRMAWFQVLDATVGCFMSGTERLVEGERLKWTRFNGEVRREALMYAREETRREGS